MFSLCIGFGSSIIKSIITPLKITSSRDEVYLEMWQLALFYYQIYFVGTLEKIHAQKIQFGRGRIGFIHYTYLIYDLKLHFC